MDLNINVNVPAINKLIDYTACGIGSVAGPMIASWKARQESKAMLEKAKAHADSLRIIADAQSEARNSLLSQNLRISGDLEIAKTIEQRIQFQEEKRQRNIESVVAQAALQLGDKVVEDSETDLDWTARFFNDVQDVSSEEMQLLWAKVLAGEVERKGSTSVRTLGILKNIDQSTANIFRRFCSACMFLNPNGTNVIDARVCSLEGSAGQNSLASYGLNFGTLNILNEHGLIISAYNSFMDYRISIRSAIGPTAQSAVIPFKFQNRHWVLDSLNSRDRSKKFRIDGVALSSSGIELSRVIDLEPMDNFAQELVKYFRKRSLQMTEVKVNFSNWGSTAQ